MRLCARDITFSYLRSQLVLDRVSLDLEPGRLLILFGPNGCGKSTLLRCLNGGLSTWSGDVLLDDRPIARMKTDEIARSISVVPQDTPNDVPFTVHEMMSMGRFAFGDQNSPETRRQIDRVLEELELTAMAHRRFDTLSGGERQRVVLARALVRDTPIYLFDEPTAHLDIGHQFRVLRLARSLAGRGKTVCLVSHDILLAPLFADTCVLLAQGRVLCRGSRPEVFTEDNIRRTYGCSLQLKTNADASLQITLPAVTTP